MDDFVPPPLPDAKPVDFTKPPTVPTPNWNILTADELFAPEDPQQLVVPHLGICPGPAYGIVGENYSGKTITTMSMLLSVVFGLPLWGRLPVQQGQGVALDHEQGRRQTKLLIRRLARGMGVSDTQLRAAVEDKTLSIAIEPEVDLTTEGAADHYARLMEGKRLVVGDSLRLMIGTTNENDSEVRPLMMKLRSASNKTGCAVVLVHHTGKPGETPKLRKHLSRGSMAIMDEFQGLLVITKKKEDPLALVTHEKDRALGMTVPNFGLRIEDVPEPVGEDDVGNPKWGIRVVYVEGDAMKAEASGIESAMERIRLYLGAQGDGFQGNQGDLRQVLEMGDGPFRAAFAQLKTRGEIRVEGSRGNLVIRYVKPPTPADINLDDP